MSDYDADVAVVGAGFAGVACARELVARGLTVTLIEARDRIGGRTWTTDFEGEKVELGGGWVHWRQPHVWSELTRYGIGITEDNWQHDFALLGSPPQRHRADVAFTRLRELFESYTDGLADALPLPHDPLSARERLEPLDAQSMQDRLDELDFSVEDRSWLSGLLYEIAGSPLDEGSLVAVLRWMALCDWNVERWYDTNRYRPIGGTQAVIDAMLADASVDLRLTTPVDAIEVRGDAAYVRCSGEELRTRGVVVATPVNVWPHIAFGPPLSAIRLAAASEGMGKPHQDKVWIRVTGDLGRVFGQLPAGEPMNFFWTYRTYDDGQLIIGINADPRLNVEDAEQVETVVRRYLPAIDRVVAVLGKTWASDEFSRGGNTCFRPRQLTRYLDALQAPEGRLTFATADIASGWMGYIDGAIESGIRAARQCATVLEDL